MVIRITGARKRGIPAHVSISGVNSSRYVGALAPKMSMIVSEIKFTRPLWLVAEGRLLGPGVACGLGYG